MTRPIDETWRVYNGTAGRDDVALEGTRDVILESVGDSPGFGEQAEARARLAAAAPAMARLLLTIENLGDDWCTTCLASLKSGTVTSVAERGHAPDCALIAVLRAAGVVE